MISESGDGDGDGDGALMGKSLIRLIRLQWILVLIMGPMWLDKQGQPSSLDRLMGMSPN